MGHVVCLLLDIYTCNLPVVPSPCREMLFQSHALGLVLCVLPLLGWWSLTETVLMLWLRGYQNDIFSVKPQGEKFLIQGQCPVR